MLPQFQKSTENRQKCKARQLPETSYFKGVQVISKTIGKQRKMVELDSKSRYDAKRRIWKFDRVTAPEKSQGK
ncbi:hypothetical protein [Desulfobacter sp.]|uniref:hypothetical protein n=1 Tax=Desulfobacter sp. TaxID=2294 RepID=UPI003D15038B